VHLRVPVLPPDRQFLPWRRGVKHAVRPLAAKRPVAAAFFLFLPPSCAAPILAEQAMSRVRWRTERREACPGRGPARITLRVLRRKKKRRSNRQPRAAARGRPPSWSPPSRLAVRGQEHGPAPGARQHTARAVKDHLTYSGAQRPARGGGARCPHTVRLPTPAPRPAQACAACPPTRAGPAIAVR
jgi:hypothetical protein